MEEKLFKEVVLDGHKSCVKGKVRHRQVLREDGVRTIASYHTSEEMVIYKTERPQEKQALPCLLLRLAASRTGRHEVLFKPSSSGICYDILSKLIQKQKLKTFGGRKAKS